MKRNARVGATKSGSPATQPPWLGAEPEPASQWQRSGFSLTPGDGEAAMYRDWTPRFRYSALPVFLYLYLVIT